MGVDYDSAGGIGIKLTDEMIKSAIKNGIFTQEEWDYDYDSCLSNMDISYCAVGNFYSGDTEICLFVEGETLGEINKNASSFIEKIKKFNIFCSVDDLNVIEEVIIS